MLIRGKMKLLKIILKGGIIIRSRELIKLLKSNGWYEDSQTGSHLKMRKEGKLHPVVIPIHTRRHPEWNLEFNNEGSGS